MKLTGAGLLFMQTGERRFADQSAGDVEIITVFVGAGTNNGIIEGYRIGLSHHDMLAQFWPAGELVGRTGPNRLCAERKVDFHEAPGAFDHLGGLVPAAAPGSARLIMPTFVHAGTRKRAPWVRRYCAKSTWDWPV